MIAGFDIIVAGLLGILVLMVALFEVLHVIAAGHELLKALKQQFLLFGHGKLVHNLTPFQLFDRSWLFFVCQHYNVKSIFLTRVERDDFLWFPTPVFVQNGRWFFGVWTK